MKLLNIRRSLYLIVVTVIVSLSFFAEADIVHFETNDWHNQIRVTWLGKFISLDNETGVASFYYFNGSKRIEYSIHVSRIYSLKIDDQDRVNQEFPPTRHVLSKALLSDLRAPRKVELDKFAQFEISEEIKHIKGERIHIRGTVISMDDTYVTLLVEKKDNTTSELRIDRTHFLMWIR